MQTFNAVTQESALTTFSIVLYPMGVIKLWKHKPYGGGVELIQEYPRSTGTQRLYFLTLAYHLLETMEGMYGHGKR